MSTSDLTPHRRAGPRRIRRRLELERHHRRLKAAGLDVVAPPNLLRGVGVDAAYLTGFVEALGRPVVLAAHSYAGAVISQTGSDASNVAGLVYVAAYAPEAGETLGAINARYPDVPLSAALRTFTYTDERGEQATDTTSTPRCSTTRCALRRPPMWLTRWRARSGRRRSPRSRPPSPARRPGRRCRPGRSSPPPITPSTPNAERDMAKRAGSEITEIDSSHAVPATHPADVAAVIVRAVKAIK